jgi:hypothetical protein
MLLDEVEIRNAEGKLIYIGTKKKIDITQLSSGQYYLVMKSGKKVITRPFMVVR